MFGLNGETVYVWSNEMRRPGLSVGVDIAAIATTVAVCTVSVSRNLIHPGLDPATVMKTSMPSPMPVSTLATVAASSPISFSTLPIAATSTTAMASQTPSVTTAMSHCVEAPIAISADAVSQKSSTNGILLFGPDSPASASISLSSCVSSTSLMSASQSALGRRRSSSRLRVSFAPNIGVRPEDLCVSIGEYPFLLKYEPHITLAASLVLRNIYLGSMWDARNDRWKNSVGIKHVLCVKQAPTKSTSLFDTASLARASRPWRPRRVLEEEQQQQQQQLQQQHRRRWTKEDQKNQDVCDKYVDGSDVLLPMQDSKAVPIMAPVVSPTLLSLSVLQQAPPPSRVQSITVSATASELTQATPFAHTIDRACVVIDSFRSDGLLVHCDTDTLSFSAAIIIGYILHCSLWTMTVPEAHAYVQTRCSRVHVPEALLYQLECMRRSMKEKLASRDKI